MGATETTGNFVRPGLGIELDAGARLARRYIPYVALELGAVPPGRRFDPANTSARTSFLGFGFRLLSGDVDSVAFASDISFGRRTFSISSDGSTWSASGWEYFRLGLGVEVRVNDRFTVSPLVSFSEGSLTDTSGSVKFAPNQPDGMVGPPYSGTGGIPGFGQSNYFTVMVGCGAHVDLFGR
jgi:hypothetical protein